MNDVKYTGQQAQGLDNVHVGIEKKEMIEDAAYAYAYALELREGEIHPKAGQKIAKNCFLSTI